VIRKILIASMVALIAILSYIAYEMYPFAKGVQHDAQKEERVP